MTRTRSRRTRLTRRGRGLLFAVLGTFLALLALVGTSLYGAVASPGDDSTSAKLAEWGRDHGLGALVTAAEDIQYRLHPPATGGTPDLALLRADITGPPTVHQVSTSTAGAGIPVRPPMPSPAGTALPGEGVFRSVDGGSLGSYVQTTFVRPDAVHTSYLTGVAWMSHLDRFVLHPGYQEPGSSSSWTQPDHLSGRALSGLIATFNSGFKLADAQGGYYDHGHTAGTLAAGAASFVVYRDGHATVGTWGQDVRMTPDVVFVRQNLQPIIANGQIAADINSHVESNWGTTVGGDLSVWRSGVGVTSTGDLVYAAGDALTAAALADVLHRAGAVNAMQLDINTSWVSFMTYTGHGTSVTPHKLGNFERPANRYLVPTSRDFVAVYAPPTA